MTYNLVSQVKELIPAEVLEQVQNGVDTAFSEAEKEGGLKTKSRWTAKEGTKEVLKIGNSTKRNWEVKKDAPGLFLLFAIGVENMVATCGSFSGKFPLPDSAVVWFKKLASKQA